MFLIFHALWFLLLIECTLDMSCLYLQWECCQINIWYWLEWRESFPVSLSFVRNCEKNVCYCVYIVSIFIRASNWPRRLVEVNGVLVVNSTQEELTNLLLHGPSAQIVVLRQPSPTLPSQQHPLLLQHTVNPGPMQTICQERDMVTMETPPQRKLMAIWWYEGQK